MTDLKATMPTAVRRALELLADPPAEPDINAYLDLLDAGNTSGRDVLRLGDRVQGLRQHGSTDAQTVHLSTANGVAEHPHRRGRAGRRVRPGRVTTTLALWGQEDTPWASTSPRRCLPARCGSKRATTRIPACGCQTAAAA
jgi:hypothetical protein